MSNEFEEKVPGITFWCKDSTRVAAMVPGEKFRVELHLTAGVSDEALFQEIERRLVEGHRIFSSDDFHVSVMDAMRASLRELEQKNALLERELRQKNDELVQLRVALNEARQPLMRFGEMLRANGGRCYNEASTQEKGQVQDECRRLEANDGDQGG
jgi:Arc/MetJ-type ribon-helix-helix transcriptional regulator